MTLLIFLHMSLQMPKDYLVHPVEQSKIIVIYRVAYLVNMLLYSSVAGMGGQNFIRIW